MNMNQIFNRMSLYLEIISALVLMAVIILSVPLIREISRRGA